MRASRSRTRDATNLLTVTPDEFALGLACALLTARDLLSLRLSCRRFNIRCISAPSGIGGGRASETLCIVEDAGRRWVARCSEQERGWAHRRDLESWLGLMREVELLRVPLVFDRAHADFTLTEDGAVATMSVSGDSRAAVSTAVMRSGRHFAWFTMEGGDMFGVIRPGWDVEGGENAFGVDGHCFYSTGDGECWCNPNAHDWEGMQTANVQGDRVGMLLDLDQGSMSIWKNGVKLGVMITEGLSGPYCWAVEMLEQGQSVRIESAALPAEA